MTQAEQSKAHQCQCNDCVMSPAGTVAQEHVMINRLMTGLNEKQRRRFAGLLAQQHGYGGIQQMAKVTGLYRHTIARGLRENSRDEEADGQIRAVGGGRHQVEKTNQTCLAS
jgi:hypothetical protein